jgi:hypothetical protein
MGSEVVMRKRLIVAFVLLAGVPGGVLSQESATLQPSVAGNPACVQDFPSLASPNAGATVVMCELDNPRGLTFSDQALYVAEAGKGGLGLSAPQCFTGQVGAQRCYGPSGAITRLWNGTQERIADGLPSHATTAGRQAIGPSDIAVVSFGNTDALALPPGAAACVGGCAYVAIGLQQPPAWRLTFPFLADFAKLVRIDRTGQWSFVADIGAYEAQSDPDQVFYNPPKLDTNPYGLLAEPNGRGVIVTDAGGNSLLNVRASGELAASTDMTISTMAAFEPHPTAVDDAVPTSIVVGPDGAYYIGELTGFPLIRGEAHVLRVGRNDDVVSCLGGFTQIMDLAFDPDGRLYVLEFQGSLIQVTPGRGVRPAVPGDGSLCTRYAEGTRTEVANGFTNPTSVAVGPDGALYVSNRGVLPGTGQVIRIAR